MLWCLPRSIYIWIYAVEKGKLQHDVYSCNPFAPVLASTMGSNYLVLHHLNALYYTFYSAWK